MIALADFLAEASMRTGSAPIVLDDPVTSLDYQRLAQVAERIVALSEKHQVIVFTHNILFACALLDLTDGKGLSYLEVIEENGRKGHVSSSSHPRTDSLKQTTGKINALIQDARSSEGEIRAAKIESAYERIRNWCEVFVEHELLQGVTERYSPHVGITKLDKIRVDRLAPAIGAIRPVFDRACRYIGGHSQPLETLGVRPTVADLEADWQQLQGARKDYIAA